MIRFGRVGLGWVGLEEVGFGWAQLIANLAFVDLVTILGTPEIVDGIAWS